MVLEAIRYKRGELLVLDQRLLPHSTKFECVSTSAEAWHSIKQMKTRGAPAIAIVAALSLAVELSRSTLPENAHDVRLLIHQRLDHLASSRPTAVNLSDAATKLKRIADRASAEPGATGRSVGDAYVEAAEEMLVHDVEDNEAMGKHGAEWIVRNTDQARRGNVSVLTHCNTGSLATAGYGTALGVIRSLHANGHLKRAYCTETRPYNQGSRLTAYELVHDEIPATLITDSMAAALMKLRGEAENIAAVIVGADRVAANGDIANKIGTYSLAILAKAHGIKFLVAAPRTTIDLDTPTGKAITIEERPGSEMTFVKGPRLDGSAVDSNTMETVSIAPNGIEVWNPAFDVTPAELIDGIVTEKGVAEKDAARKFHLQDLFTDSNSTRNA